MLGRTLKQIGVFVPATPGYMSDVLEGVLQYARSASDWVIEVCHNIAIAEAAVKWWRPDGVLVDSADGDWIGLLKRLGVPAVQVGGPKIEFVPSIVTDNDAIGRLAARHFIERGFRRFAFLGYENEWSLQRRDAFAAGLAEAGLRCDVVGTRAGLLHANFVQGALADWVRTLPSPCAVFACHDRAAMLLCRACDSLRVEVPEQVAILGVDNNRVDCRLTTPLLSSIMGSARRIGYQGALTLDRLMRGERVPAKSVPIAPAGVAVRGSSDIYATDDPDLLAALKFIKDHADESIEVTDVARAVIATRRMLERKFRDILGRSPREQILLAHIDRAKHLLMHDANLSMLDIAVRSGFPSGSKFSAVFKRETGLTPKSFRKLYGQAGG